jgi:hypothetical protein
MQYHIYLIDIFGKNLRCGHLSATQGGSEIPPKTSLRAQGIGLLLSYNPTKAIEESNEVDLTLFHFAKDDKSLIIEQMGKRPHDKKLCYNHRQ